MLEHTTPDKLVDISTVSTNKDLPKQERINEFARQIKNPYFYKSGTFSVTARFPKNGPSFEECLQGMVT